MKKNVDLLASYWTIAVNAEPHTGPEFSSAPFIDRVAAAARAGFTGMGIWHADLEHTLRSMSLTDMRHVLDDHGIRHIELEFLNDWFVDDLAKHAEYLDRKKLLFAAAEAFQADHIKVGDFFNTPCPMPKLIESFASLCKDAREIGTDIHFELMPFANINTLAGALDLVQGADATNGKIIFDLWHVVKLGIPYADVAAVPARFVGGIEINDGRIASMPDMTEETTKHRNLCGEGEFDVKGFVRMMLDAGYRGPWGIEVLNQELRRQPLEEVAQRAAATTFAQFPD